MAADQDALRAHRQAMRKIEDAQSAAGQNLKKLEEQEMSIGYLQRNIRALLQDVGYSRCAGINSPSAHQDVYWELREYEEDLTEAVRRTARIIEDERARLRSVRRELEQKREDLISEYKSKQRGI